MSGTTSGKPQSAWELCHKLQGTTSASGTKQRDTTPDSTLKLLRRPKLVNTYTPETLSAKPTIHERKLEYDRARKQIFETNMEDLQGKVLGKYHAKDLLTR